MSRPSRLTEVMTEEIGGRLREETYRALVDRGFPSRAAFTITLRVHRGGGLAKDAMYLRGLSRLLEYLSGGGAFDRLFVGKYAFGHAPVVEELLLRGVLREPDVLPLYLSRPDVERRLSALQAGMGPMDLVRG